MRGIEGKVGALRWARTHLVPTLGICLGLQCMVIEYARDVAGIEGASSTEFDPKSTAPVIATMEEQKAFVEGAGDALSPAERALLVTGAKVIVYEQAVRFLGDHLDGDRYYRTTRPGHNLDRARNQVRLLESLEAAIG